MAYDKVVDSAVLDGAMTATANAIREKVGNTERIAWDKAKGFSSAMGEVYEAGKKAEHDAFWDAYQDYGNRTSYDNAFGGHGWKPDNFKPKYDIRPTMGYMMFRGFSFVDNGYYADVAKHLEDLGIVLDTSNCTNFQYAFQWCFADRFGKIDLTKCTSANSIFAYSYIREIDEIVFSDITHINDGMFEDCSELEKVKFSGVIAKNGLDLHWSTKLDKASISSVINTLSTTTTGLTVTLSKAAVNNAFGGSTSAEWLALVATRSNWNISLV